MPYTNPKNGSHTVLLKRGEFLDESRNRLIPYKIYHPEKPEQKTPIILWSHGFGGNRDGASFISRYLAAHGYTLIHITHHGTDSSLWEGQPGHPWDILRQIKIPRASTLNRMHDIPFVLDQLPEWAEQNPEAGQHLDLSRIGMSGHSFGAMTTQTIAGMLLPDETRELKSFRDSRVQAGILYSPVPIKHLTNAPPQQIYSPIEIPLFHMTGTQDDSPLENHGYQERLIIHEHAGHNDQYLMVLQDGDHMVFNGTRGKLEQNPHRETHEAMIKTASLAFWDAYLKNDERALQWLKENYKP